MSQIKDPVCGMIIDPESAAGSTTYESQKVYFCSDQCRRENYCLGGVCAARTPAGSACDEAVDSCLNSSCIAGSCADFLLETVCLFGSTE